MGIVGKWAESLDYQYEINEKLCVRHKSPFSSCMACVDICEDKAITLLDGHPILNNELCTECGKCLAICPTQAIAGIYPKRQIFDRDLLLDENHIPSVKELLIYQAKGIKAIATESKEMNAAMLDRINEVNNILLQLSKEQLQVKTDFTFPEEEAATYSRRELFSLWKNESKTLVSQVTPAKWRFNQDDFELAKYYNDVQFFQVNLEVDQCTTCKICVSLCDKNVFALSNNELTISNEYCTNCKLCADACQENAITIIPNIADAQKHSYPIFHKTCPDCKKDFQTIRSGDEKCLICSKRKAGYLRS